MSEFLQYLDALDKEWILAINNDYPTFWDNLMFLISGKLSWVALYLSIMAVAIVRWKKASVWIVLTLILSVVLADQISSGLIKHSVARLRPSHDPTIQNMLVYVNDYRGGLYGFVSSHAANSFAVATLVALLFRHATTTITLFVWAIINSYSRLYLGVHYVSDVLSGGILGVCIAFLLYWLLKKIRPYLFPLKWENKRFSIAQREISIELLSIFATLLTFLVLVILSL